MKELRCAKKKQYDNEGIALEAMKLHNRLSNVKGWVAAKSVYCCPYCGKWHISTLSAYKAKSQQLFHEKNIKEGRVYGAYDRHHRKSNHVNSHTKKGHDRKRSFMLAKTQEKLLTEDGRYRKPTLSEFDWLPIEHKYYLTFNQILSWWESLPDNQKITPQQ